MTDSSMPDDPSPEELRLPDELAAFEALLAAKPLAAVGIDRDELMYRAGWAACQAQALIETRGCPPAEPGAASVRRTVGWSLASAALAASVAVMGMWGWDSAGRGRLDGAGGETPRLATVAGESTAAAPELVRADARPARNGFALSSVDRLLEPSGREGLTIAGPWFAMQRRQAATGSHDRAGEIAANSETLEAAPKTARELWEELLPHDSTPPESRWPWQLRSNGESI